ncbi:MAG: ECF transporter S component [Oscillospiraceae bacterium]|nr:ECF transporter S component [Oscillospiraceae bacterium]
MKNKTNFSKQLRTLTATAMLSAIAVVLVYLIHFPLIPAAAFLEYDPADVPIFFVALVFGPWWALGMTAVVSIVQGFTVSATSGVVGLIMHFIATGSFAVITGFVSGSYKKSETAAMIKQPSLTKVIVAFSIGVLTMTILMAGMNLIFIPIFNGTPVDAVLQMLIPIIIPFNLLKSIINAVVAFLLYAALRKPLANL